jgi:hypothetical protein
VGVLSQQAADLMRQAALRLEVFVCQILSKVAD